jgi:signal peptidase I
MQDFAVARGSGHAGRMGRNRTREHVAIAVAVVLSTGAVLMYFLNPFHTASRDPRGRIFGHIPYRVPAMDMEPTIHKGSFILARTWPLAFREPRVGEIIVFYFPPSPEIAYIKRVIAAGGSTVEILGGVVLVDGRVLREPYVPPKPILPPEFSAFADRFALIDDFPSVQVPEGQFFVLGDNRGNSEDSRSWGFVPRELVIGVYNPGEP